MSCRDCINAEANPRSDAYSAGCFGCKARAIAAVGAHIESQALKVIAPDYRRVLEQIFGNFWKDGAAEVKLWAARINAAAKHRKVNT